MKTQPATGETYPKSDLFNKATVTQLQEQTLPFGVKLLCVSICFFLMSGWYGEKLYSFGIEMLNLAFARG
ncbi:EscS/YscS/HrcS family type III secretion system export apparatus protein [Escherichia coli]|uniref:EscS/YscS/HrcS family type III secretion system export apparatus protein n=1 Tax=Escherichia coli TaxID=562 RepID=UPI001F49F4A6|nr:flagellar biosynthetic protein FliQ [Escherichia coli]MCH7137159.1 EscS/YscS/HrcS family type III secretion system export apparatus protein [Escherichia coli]